MLWAVSESSNRFVRQLGLLLFLGAVGTNAGSQIVGVVGSVTASGIPAVAYATVYPFAMIFMMVCAQLIAALY